MPLFRKRAPVTTTQPATTTTTYNNGRVRTPVHHHAIFAILFILGAVELGLTADTVRWINNNSDFFNPSFRRRVKYALFCAVWTVVISLVWLPVPFLTRIFHWMHHTIILLLTTIFWLIAASLIESKVGDDNDSGACSLVLGSGKCKELKALRAFAWILFTVSLLATLASIFMRRRHDAENHHTTATHPTTTTTTTNPSNIPMRAV